MLTTVFYQCVECLADPMWELRRMAGQVTDIVLYIYVATLYCFFTALHLRSRGLAVSICPSVCPFLCLSNVHATGISRIQQFTDNHKGTVSDSTK